MFGVPADLDLSAYLGATLTQVCLGEFQLQFHFYPSSRRLSSNPEEEAPAISCEGDWCLLDPSGRELDRSMDHTARTEYRIHLLLGKAVTETRVEAPKVFELVFEGGYVLRFVEDDRPYESYQLYPSGHII